MGDSLVEEAEEVERIAASTRRQLYVMLRESDSSSGCVVAESTLDSLLAKLRSLYGFVSAPASIVFDLEQVKHIF